MQHPRFTYLSSFLVIPSMLVALAACGDGGSGSGGGGASATGGGGTTTTSTTQKEPKTHRATATACTADRPPGLTDAMGGACANDADCTDGTNGRCHQTLNDPPFCSYDECQSDKDCGVAACECRNPARFDANVCVHGNCVTDADCNGGYCSPSAVTLDPYCSLDIPIGSVGYYCHSAADECVDDEDCSQGTGSFPGCLFDADKGHWACREILCVN